MMYVLIVHKCRYVFSSSTFGALLIINPIEFMWVSELFSFVYTTRLFILVGLFVPMRFSLVSS